MGIFSHKGSSETFGVLFDIGSGSVLTAIVHSKDAEPHPQIIWSHREHAPLRNVDSLQESAKAVMTALMNAAIELDTVGRQTLNEHSPGARVGKIQASIAAPWSYTVSKTINFDQDDTFTITQQLIDDLVIATEEKIAKELKANEAIDQLGLSVITEATMDVLANGYRVASPEGGEANHFTLSRASVVAQEYLINALNDAGEKMFTNIPNRKLSFILMMYSVIQDLLPNIYDVCLVDVTFEATEIGVVRNGALKYCTHAAFGSFSLAREIAAVTKVPLHEAFGYLHTEKPLTFLEGLNKGQREEVEKVMESYVERLADLFTETGDTLTIPKRIALHADLKSEPFFLNMVELAAKRATRTAPSITPISKEIIRQTYDPQSLKQIAETTTDTALLLSAMFFHKHHDSSAFEYR